MFTVKLSEALLGSPEFNALSDRERSFLLRAVLSMKPGSGSLARVEASAGESFSAEAAACEAAGLLRVEGDRLELRAFAGAREKSTSRVKACRERKRERELARLAAERDGKAVRAVVELKRRREDEEPEAREADAERAEAPAAQAELVAELASEEFVAVAERARAAAKAEQAARIKRGERRAAKAKALEIVGEVSSGAVASAMGAEEPGEAEQEADWGGDDWGFEPAPAGAFASLPMPEAAPEGERSMEEAPKWSPLALIEAPEAPEAEADSVVMEEPARIIDAEAVFKAVEAFVEKSEGLARAEPKTALSAFKAARPAGAFNPGRALSLSAPEPAELAEWSLVEEEPKPFAPELEALPPKARKSKAARKARSEPVVVQPGVVQLVVAQEPQEPLEAVPAGFEWMPQESWLEWLEHRREIKKPLNARGKTKFFNKIKLMRAKGLDVAGLMDNSIENGWASVYEPKSNSRAGERAQGERAQRRGTGGVVL